MKSRHFVDTVPVDVRAGSGGGGCCSFRREKFVPRGGPDGGDGGRGGDVVLLGDEDTDSLVALFYSPRLIAENGVPGAGRQQHGRNGRTLVVPVPLGTTVVDPETDEALGDVVEHGQRLVVARGGRGGLGNVHWKRADHQVPREHTPGEPGEERRLRMDLRLLADAGLVGFPSAGKSSLLRCISRARPKVAAYPFTTLHPLIGTVEYPEQFASLRVADIPGLIEDAHRGVGLGFSFLRHIERSRVLVFVVDMAGVDNRHPWDDYRALRHELGMHDPELLERPRILLANKMDLPAADENWPIFIRETGETPVPISTVSNAGVETLKQRLYELVRPSTRRRRQEAPVEASPKVMTVGGPRRAPGGKAGSKAARPGRSAPAGDAAPRKGYTPPRPLEGRGEHPGAPDTVSEEQLAQARFLDRPPATP